jgi:DNA-binding XRE family transcriptional regulator
MKEARSKSAFKKNSLYREIGIRKAVSDLICTQRNQHSPKLTQEELAYRSGISFEHLNHIENYRSIASIEVLDRIAQGLGFKRISELLACDPNKIL